MKNLLAFILGAAIGSGITYYIVKEKYESIIDEEVQSVKDSFKKKEEVSEEKEESMEESKPTPNYILASDEELSNFDDLVEASEYTEQKEKEFEDRVNSRPYIIPPEEAGESGYDIMTLLYYKDHVLTDEDNNIIEDIDDVIGFDSLTRFGEFEDDTVYVRNDKYRVDYEVINDPERTFSDVFNVY